MTSAESRSNREPALPTLFVSHGAPNLLLYDSPVRTFLMQLASFTPTPRAVLCVSAHWLTRKPTVDVSPSPKTIHDFYGFEPELYEMQYPTVGAPELAEEVAQALSERGLDVQRQARGLDHGAWVPMKAAFAAGNVPVTQLSLQPDLDARHHYEIGLALASLRKRGVLVIGSGGATHNLGAMRDEPDLAERAQKFDRWLAERAQEGDAEALSRYLELGPEARWNHPTADHYLPVVVALGAAGEKARGRTIHESSTLGVLSLRAFAFA